MHTTTIVPDQTFRAYARQFFTLAEVMPTAAGLNSPRDLLGGLDQAVMALMVAAYAAGITAARPDESVPCLTCNGRGVDDTHRESLPELCPRCHGRGYPRRMPNFMATDNNTADTAQIAA